MLFSYGKGVVTNKGEGVIHKGGGEAQQVLAMLKLGHKPF